jgi:predicted ATP-dependent protease
MILSGYLAERYTQDKPLNLSARLVFEQSYSDVEGDSASSTELYAILSALSGLPIKQGIAVTGSVNQKGEVQAIGGVNEKVEGFFEICLMSGDQSEQSEQSEHGEPDERGVIIPESNVTNLMLKEEVIEAVKQGAFHIWAVKTIDEGIEILTGAPAGHRQEDGSFEEGSVNDRVNQRLKQMAEILLYFGKDREEKSKQEKDREEIDEEMDKEKADKEEVDKEGKE